MGDWKFFTLISLVISVFSLSVVMTSHCRKKPLLPCVKKKAQVVICIFASIFWIVSVVLFGLDVSVAFSKEEPSGQTSNETHEVVEDVKNRFTESNNILQSLNMDTFNDAKKFPIAPSLVNFIVLELKLISEEREEWRTKAVDIFTTETTMKAFLDQLEKDGCPVPPHPYDNLETGVKEFKTWSDAVERGLKDLRSAMDTTLTDYSQNADSEMEKEKNRIKDHSVNVQKFIEKFYKEWDDGQKAVDENGSKSKDVEKKTVENDKNISIAMIVFGILLIVAVVYFWIFVLSSLRCIQSITPWIFYVSFLFVVGCIGCYVYFFIVSEDCPTSFYTIKFDLPIPVFDERNPLTNLNEAFEDCRSAKQKLFTAPHDKIYIIESLLLEKYRKMWNKTIADFKQNVDKFKFDVSTFNVTVTKLVGGLQQTLTDCVSDPTEIGRYLTILSKIANHTQNYYGEIDDIYTGLGNLPQKEIDKKLAAIKTIFDTQIEIFDGSVKKLAFDCSKVYGALNGPDSKCVEQKSYDSSKSASYSLLCLSICILLFAVLYSSSTTNEKKKKKTADKETKQEVKNSSATELGKDSSNVQLDNSSNVPLAKATSTVSAKGGEISINPIEHWANLISSIDFENVLIVFEENLVKFKPPNATYKASDANKNLNHNKNYQCIDESRVILKNRNNEYINASWVRIPNSKTPYIITQNPLAETIADFWAMCYAVKVKCIVSFCSPDEGLGKCVPYFATDGTETQCTGYTVKIGEPKKDVLKNSIVRKLQVLESNKSGAQPLLINHVTVSWWPKKAESEKKESVPKETQSAIELHRWAKKLYPDVSPICVVSEEGLGRSATFVLLDYAIIRLQQGATMPDIVKEFRGMRNMAIENRTQYEVLHALLLEYFADEGVLDTTVLDTFKKNYTDRHFS